MPKIAIDKQKTFALENNQLFLALLFFILLGFISYSNSLLNGFLIDDRTLVEKNQNIRSWEYIPTAFVRSYTPSYYRPLVTISFIYDSLFWENNPFGFHLTNIFLHSFVSFLFFLLLWLLFDDFLLALLTGSLFEISALNSVSVNYISDRGNLLVSCFMLLGMLAFYFACKKGCFRFYLYGIIFLVFALLSRENAILFPFYLLCVLLASYDKKSNKRVLAIFGIVLPIVLAYLMLRKKYFPMPGILFFKPPAGEFLMHIGAFLKMIQTYIRLSIFPYNVLFFRELTPLPLNFWLIFYGFSLIAGFFILFSLITTKKPVIFALFWFLIGTVPLFQVMNYRIQYPFIMQDSWLYFSSMGIFLLIGILLSLSAKRIPKWAFIVVITIIAAFNLGLTWRQNSFWLDTKRYCNYWETVAPSNYISSRSLGQYYVEKGNFNKAIFYFKKALKQSLYTHNNSSTLTNITVSIYIDLASIYCKQENFLLGKEYLKKALDADPQNILAHYLSGVICEKEGQLETAIFHFNKVIEKKFNSAKTHQKLYTLYTKLGKKTKALEHVQYILDINPALLKQ